LSHEDLSTRIHLSSLGNCFNSYAVDFYKSLGVNRIILPRQLTLSEIQGIVTNRYHQMEFEVFALNDGCLFEEGFCQTSHALNGPFCLEKWDVAITTYGNATKVNAQELDKRLQELREYLWFLNNCGSSFQQDCLPNGPCSLCFLGRFRDWGVTSVKIVGREASFYRKMTSLQLVKAVMDDVRNGKTPEEVAHRARSIRNTPHYCQKGYMCYFRES
jgi:putative protease